MTDHWRGAADQVARDLARVKDERNRLRAEIDDLRSDVERLRGRTHEIQAQEMAKRAALDSQLAEWRQRWDYAKQWTEDQGLLAEWASGEFARSPFWGMTSYAGRSAVMRLVTERNEARAQLAEAQAAIRALVRAPNVGDPPRPVDPHCDLSPDGQHLRGTGRDRGECRFCDVPMPIGPTLPPPTGEVP